MEPAQKKKRSKGDKADVATIMQKQMLYIFPVLIVWIASRLPAAFALYILTTTVFSIWQHWFISKRERSVAAEEKTEPTVNQPAQP